MGYEGDRFSDVVQRLAEANERAGYRMADRMVDRGMENIRMNTPVETFHLRQSYKRTPIKKAISSGRGVRWSAFAWTGRVYTEVEYAPFVEFGTGLWGPKRKKYKIAPKKPGGVLAFTPYQRVPNGSVILDVEGAPSRSGPVIVRFVMHPGSSGNHMFQIGTTLTEAQHAEWSMEPLRLWKNEVEGKISITAGTQVKKLVT